MRSIVTGGAGFIGSHIVDKLISMNHEVIVIDNESSNSNDQFYYNDKAKYFKIDISDYTGIRPLFRNVDYVFHLAAESRIQNCVDNPLLCFNTNLYGTAAVLQSAHEAKCKKLIYSSTSAIYGLKNKSPMIEDMKDDCLNAYSVSKFAGEKMCEMYSNLYGLNTLTFRYFNVFGPREPVKGPYAPVIGLFLRQKNENKTLTVTGDGLQRRDFVHVYDVVEANIMAMQKETTNQVLNVGSGRNFSILEIAELISNNIKHISKREGEARETLADISKIENVLNWKSSKNIKDYIMEKL